MPWLVKDSDVLGEIGLVDAQVASQEKQVLSVSVTASTGQPAKWQQFYAAWTTDVGSWSDWAKNARERLSGGFLFGEWDTTADGNAAVAWKLTFDGYQSIINTFASGQAPAAAVPAKPTASQVADANNAAALGAVTGPTAGAVGALEGVVKWAAIGLVAVAVGAVVLTGRR